MKFVYPEIDFVFDTDSDKINTVIVENQHFLFKLLSELHSQISGFDGQCVLSDNGKTLDFSKSSELITEFIPFELNKKTLISKVCSAFEKEAMLDENFIAVNEMLAQIESNLIDLSQSFNCDINFSKVNFSSLIKSAGIEFNEDYDSLGEKVIDYFELVSEFDRKKLFFTFNLRSFLSDIEAEMFLDTIIKHGYNLIMIESSAHKSLHNEQRFIVDSSLCEIK